MRRPILFVLLLFLLGISTAQAAALPVPGTVTMVDLGADSCIPCKMMAPILTKLKTEYAGRAEVAFIDVWKNPDAAKEYGIRVIPTQIFYNKAGKEITRHEGFLDEDSIRTALEKLLKE